MGFFGSGRNLGTGVVIKQWRGLARTPRSCGLREMSKHPLSRLIFVRHSFGVSRRHIATRKRVSFIQGVHVQFVRYMRERVERNDDVPGRAVAIHTRAAYKTARAARRAKKSVLYLESGVDYL